MTRTRKFPWGWIIAGIIVGLGIYWLPGMFHKNPADGAGAAGAMGGAPKVSTATVIAKNVNQWTEFSGILQAVDAVDIHPRVSGQIMQVHFADGSDVKKGQLLFTIDQRPYAAQLLQARGALATAQAAQANAQQNLARAKQLIKIKAISQNEYEQQTSLASQAAGALSAAKGQAEAAEVNMEYTKITAPISGKISRAEVTVGNLVEAGANAPLLASIVTVSPLYASFDLDEKSFLATIQGVPSEKLKTIPVEVGLANDQGTPVKASIHSFDNQIVAGSGTIRVRALVPNKDERLVPGLFARIRIGTPDETPAILINPMAIGTDQDKKFVLRVGEGNKVEYRAVILDGSIDGMQVITSGLQEGDQIVVTPSMQVQPGMPITPVPVDMVTLKPLTPEPAPSDAAAAPASAPSDKPADASN